MAEKEKSELSKLASLRNFQLFRITGFHLDTTVMTTEERYIYIQIRASLQKLKDEWDDNSVKMGLHLKPYKCIYCGKRSDKRYIVQDPVTHKEEIVCKKHYESFTNG